MSAADDAVSEFVQVVEQLVGMLLDLATELVEHQAAAVFAQQPLTDEELRAAA